MGSLNEAFIKAYGRDASSESTTTAPPVTSVPAPAASQTLENWYSASNWYRVETAAPSPVAPPHQPLEPVAYQPPSPSELSDLWVPVPAASDPDYRLSPAEPVPPPEVVIEEELVAGSPPQAVVLPPAPAPAPLALASAPKVAPASKVAATIPTLVTPDFERMFAPMQFTTGWESSLMTLPPISTAGPVPVVTPPAPVAAVSKPAPQEALKVEAKAVTAAPLKQETSTAAAQAPVAAAVTVTVEQPAAVAKPVVEPKLVVDAKPLAVEKPAAKPVPDLSPRLDSAVASPLPKPHVTFNKASAPTAPTSTHAKSAEPAAKPAEPAAKQAPPPVTLPAAAPMGIVQPAWEVDRFQWPEHCKQLLSTENEYLADVGVRLSNAARDGLNILAVTSTRRGEGRTTLALCLARAAAQAGVKVALVDADIENPQLVNELGVEASCGWHDVVLGKQPLAEAAIVSLEDKFAFFPWTESSVKSLNDSRVTRVLREIAKAYSLVILDLGPVPGRETRLFEDGDACPVDAAILVRDVRWTSAIEAQRVAGQLTTAGVDSVGIAENFGPRAQQAA